MMPFSRLTGSGRVLADGDELPDIPNFKVSAEGIVTWDAVPGVNIHHYSVGLFIAGSSDRFWVEADTRMLDVKEKAAHYGYESTTIKIMVYGYASASESSSKAAESKQYLTYDYVALGPQLDPPTNFKWDGAVLSWEMPDPQAECDLAIAVRPEGDSFFHNIYVKQKYTETSLDLTNDLLYGTHSYYVRITARRYGFPDSETVWEYLYDYSCDRETTATLDEYSVLKLDEFSARSATVFIMKDGQTLTTAEYYNGVAFPQDDCEKAGLPEGTYDVRIEAYREVDYKKYLSAKPWTGTFEYAKSDLYLFENPCSFKDLYWEFNGQVGYIPSKKIVRFLDLDLSTTKIGKEIAKYGWTEEGYLLSCKNDMTLEGNAKVHDGGGFFKSGKTLTLSENSVLDVDIYTDDAISADKIVIEGGTLSIKSNDKSALCAKSSLVFGDKIKSVLSESAAGFGAVKCENGKITLSDKLHIAIPTGGNLGSDAHYIYNANKTTVADKAKVVANTPTPTPTNTPIPSPKPTGATPKPTGVTPKPTGSTPRPTGVTPKPTGATPKPTGTTPKPTGTTPKPTGVTPKPTGVTPKPTGVTPKPTGVTPKPTGVTPKPTGVTPKPTGVTPKPTGVTPKPTGVTPKPTGTTPKPTPEKEPSIADFVERLYTIALDRPSEPEGKAFWVNEIESGNRTGGDCAHFFLIEAQEFLNRGLTAEDFVETLYLTFFDRASEPAGKKFWVDSLKSGKMTKENVINGFIDSTEWCNVCATYGVKSGAPHAKAEFASKNAIKFATRLYTCCLGRDPEEGGLKYWSLALTNLEQTGCSAAKNFFTSDEFVNFKLKDDEYVRRLYTTFMGREPEASEIAYWVGEIAKGTQTKDTVMAFFGQSEEFTNICKQYGIDRGTI